MAPEQWVGGAVDVRTDVYSLGVLAYEMLTGEPPFLGESGSIAMEHATHAPPSLVERAPLVARGVAGVIESALAKDPVERPLSARAFAGALRAQTETTRKLLRRSVLLTLEHYGLLVRRTLIVTLPLVMMAIVSALAGHFIGGRAGTVITSACFLLGSYVGVLLLAPVAGLLVPLIEDLSTSGLAVRPSPQRADLWRPLRDSLVSTHVEVVLMLVASSLARAPFAILARLHVTDSESGVFALTRVVLAGAVVAAAIALFSVRGAAVVMEGSRGLEPLRRSAELLRPMWLAAFGVCLFCGGLIAGLLEFSGLLARDLATRLPAVAFLASPSPHLSLLLVSVVGLMVRPFQIVPPALLYLRAREAGGAGERRL